MSGRRRGAPKVHREHRPNPIMEGETLRMLRDLLDRNRAYDVLNDPRLRDAMRGFVQGAGSVTRADIATQAFCFAVELERERFRSILQFATWPCHDHPWPQDVMREMQALIADAP